MHGALLLLLSCKNYLAHFCVHSINDACFFLLANTAPSDYPSGFLCTVFESQYIALVWREVHIEAQNGPILGYHVRRHGSTRRPTVYVIEGKENRTLRVVDDLRPGKTYAFSIAAYNKAGVGQFSPVVFVPPLEEGQ